MALVGLGRLRDAQLPERRQPRDRLVQVLDAAAAAVGFVLRVIGTEQQAGAVADVEQQLAADTEVLQVVQVLPAARRTDRTADETAGGEVALGIDVLRRNDVAPEAVALTTREDQLAGHAIGQAAAGETLNMAQAVAAQ